MNDLSVGSLISLHWDGDPEALYVRGHVPPETFREAVAGYYGVDDISFGDTPILTSEPVHRWGRYCFDGQDSYGNARRALRTFNTPSRGAFKVTAADVTWERRPRCRGEAGTRPCWIRADHKGPHMDFDAWRKRCAP